jgi:hypothetical protein
MVPENLARDEANVIALTRMVTADPHLVDVAPAISVVPGMTRATILTSGAPLTWPEYTGGQRRAVMYAAVYEGLAQDLTEAEDALNRGEIRVRSNTPA